MGGDQAVSCYQSPTRHLHIVLSVCDLVQKGVCITGVG